MGGVGHVNVMFILRWCYVDGRGGVGPRGAIDMLVFLWSSHADVYLTMLYIYIYTYTYIHIYFHTYRKFRELSMSSLQPASKVWDRAPWALWKRTCCSMLQQGVDVETTTSKNKGDCQHVPFHANKKKTLQIPKRKTALDITPRAAVKTVLFRLNKINDFHDMCYFVWENKKNTLKKNMLQQADEVEATTSKKRLTINMCRFMLTLKFTANTNKKDTSSYYPTCRNKNWQFRI